MPIHKKIFNSSNYDAIADRASSIAGSVSGFVKESAQDFADAAQSAVGFASRARSRNLPSNGSPNNSQIQAEASFTSAEGRDWRVKLSLPESYEASPLLQPLVTTGGLAFPFTPTIVLSHSANYNAIQPVHTNYPFYAYENSQIDQLIITAPFVVQNALEAQYWLGALHYLRSVTKMAYGNSSNNGSPPPVVRLNGYGDYIFNNVPVTISNFTLDLPGEVDYIATSLEIGGTSNVENIRTGAVTVRDGISYVPVESQITVTVQPTYSRSQVEQFNLDQFVRGGMILQGKGFI